MSGGANEAPRYRAQPLDGSLSAHCEARADGSTLVTSSEPLQLRSLRLTDRLLHSAETSPDQTLAAKRHPGGGDWRRLGHAQALHGARCRAADIFKVPTP